MSEKQCEHDWGREIMGLICRRCGAEGVECDECAGDGMLHVGDDTIGADFDPCPNPLCVGGVVELNERDSDERD